MGVGTDRLVTEARGAVRAGSVAHVNCSKRSGMIVALVNELDRVLHEMDQLVYDHSPDRREVSAGGR
jgi:hypothetical protein